MIETGAIVDDESFQIACNSGYTEIVRMLLDLERGVNPAANDNRALRNACYFGQLEIVCLLLDLPPERGVDPAAIDNYALRTACIDGHTDIVRLLLELPLERGVHPAVRNEAFRNACYYGHTEIVRLLLDLPLKRGVISNAICIEAIMTACRFGYTDILRQLLQLELACPLATPFAYACLHGHTECVRLLLLHRKNFIVDHHVLIRRATENGSFEIILLYITHQNDFNVVSEIEMLLRHACVYDVSELIRMLVDAELIRRAVIQAATNMYPLARMLGRDKICAMLEEIIQANEFTSFDHFI